LKPERWGSRLVQEKYQEEKACDKRHPDGIIIIIIIIIIINNLPVVTLNGHNIGECVGKSKKYLYRIVNGKVEADKI